MVYLYSILLVLLITPGYTQDLSGKWFGKITQQPGGYSQLYNIELDLNQKRNLWGDSFAYEGDSVRIRIGLFGRIDQDSIRLSEERGWIREDKVPWTWVACIKQYSLAYRKEDKFEYLEGTWTGYSKENPSEDCIPGRVILSRTSTGLEEFLKEHRDSVIQVELTANAPEPVNFDEPFMETEPKKVTEIVVFQPKIQIQLLDHMKVDNDTVTVYLNRNILAKNIRISKRPSILNFSLNPDIEVHEILLYAENLGKVPPNTSELILVDGERRHRIMIVSDKEKTAALYLRYNSKRRR